MSTNMIDANATPGKTGKISVLTPEWPAPQQIHAFTTLRTGGVSKGPYSSLNLGHHVGDDPEAISENWGLLRKQAQLPNLPMLMSQVHGKTVLKAETAKFGEAADAIYTETPHQICTVLTGDCLPILLCDKQGQRVAAVHAGWRGLAIGVLDACLSAWRVPIQETLVWLGPAIGPQGFIVKADVLALFQDGGFEINESTFKPVLKDEVSSMRLNEAKQDNAETNAETQDQYWRGNLYALAEQRLQVLGLPKANLFGGGRCTYTEANHFYSFRRDKITGRMASMIWIAAS